MYDAIIVGASIIDLPAGPVDASVFEIGTMPVERITMQVGGDAINEATILAYKGAKVKLISKIGNDLGGRFILEHCHKHGIDTSSFAVDGTMDTGINLVLIDSDGERSFITSNRGGLRQIKPEDIPLDVLPTARLLCFASIFTYPYFATKELAWLFKAAKDAGMILCADMTKCKNRETVADMADAFSYLDYVFPNYEEAKLLTGKDDVDEIADALLMAGVKNVIIKLGAKGCFLKNSMNRIFVPASPGIHCLDSTGAGDNFVAGFIYGLLQNLDLKRCAQLANKTAAESIQHIGATTWIEAQNSRSFLNSQCSQHIVN